MATPIAPTPVLEGRDAENFWRADSEENLRLPLTPTPELKETRERMLADDRNHKK